jgi:hypothetical protein
MEWDRWCMMALIGFTTGFVGFLLHQIIARITEVGVVILFCEYTNHFARYERANTTTSKPTSLPLIIFRRGCGSLVGNGQAR